MCVSNIILQSGVFYVCVNVQDILQSGVFYVCVNVQDILTIHVFPLYSECFMCVSVYKIS